MSITKCNICETLISDNDSVAWKCVECGKIFKVNLSKLKKLQILKNKPENFDKALLKCPACGNGLDSGNEKIACKCSVCGNIMIGNLRDFAISESRQVEDNIKSEIHVDEIKENPRRYKNNNNEEKRNKTGSNKRKSKNGRKTIFGILIILVGVIFAAINPIRTIYYDKYYTNTLLDLLQQNLGSYEYVDDIEITNIMDKDRFIVLIMNQRFDSLSREDKHKYMKSDLGNKIQDIYSDWMYSNETYNNQLWEMDDYPYDHIEVRLDCNEKTYKYGYYQKPDGYSDYIFKDEFLDIDGMSYEFVNKEEEAEYYKKLEEKYSREDQETQSNSSNNDSTSENGTSSYGYTGPYDAELKFDGTDGVLICVSEDAMDRFMTAANNQNEGSLYELLLNGEVAYTEQGTKCNIVDRKFTRCQVRLLDGSYAGSTVWVVIEALQEK